MLEASKGLVTQKGTTWVDFFEINVEKFSNFRWFFSKP